MRPLLAMAGSCVLIGMIMVLSEGPVWAGFWDAGLQQEQGGSGAVKSSGCEAVAKTVMHVSEQITQVREAENGNDEDSDEPVLEPGQWELVFGLDNQLFPAAIIALSTLNPEDIGVERNEHSFGSPLGMASVFVRGTAPGDKVKVEITSTALIQPSEMNVVLEDPDTEYEISPHLKYKYEKLLSIRQPYPEDVTAKVYLNGRQIGEKTRTIIVRSINDCFFGIVTDDGSDFQDWSEMFAAYVNEGDPLIDGILSEALKKGYVDAFIGYQGGQADVLGQVQAVWQVLQDRGIKYSSITTTSVESDTVMAQHVRLVGDSTRGAQANCADGTVLFASIFRKLGLNAYLVILPRHMMVGVSMDEKNSTVAYIETTMLADASLDQAMKSAEETIDGYDDDQVTLVNINAAREAGILPLRDLNR